MTTTAPRTVSLEITSDTICPFCYVGYKRIISAIDLYNKSGSTPANFSIRFSPFQLNPALPTSPGLDKMENYHRKFGDPERVKNMIESMIERGKKDGINFSYGGRVSNSIDSHRVLEKAYEKGGETAQRKVAEAFFKHYFEEEGDIGDHDALARKVDATGVMSKEETLKFLKSGELRDTVEAGIRKAGMRGITGVPYIIINGRLAISGAQEAETFVDVFKQAATMD